MYITLAALTQIIDLLSDASPDKIWLKINTLQLIYKGETLQGRNHDNSS